MWINTKDKLPSEYQWYYCYVEYNDLIESKKGIVRLLFNIYVNTFQESIGIINGRHRFKELDHCSSVIKYWQEEWKPIDEFDGRYSISNLCGMRRNPQFKTEECEWEPGTYRDVQISHGMMLNIYTHKKGFRYCKLTHNNGSKRITNIDELLEKYWSGQYLGI